MRISTTYGPTHVQDKLTFNPNAFDAEMRVAEYAIGKFGVVTDLGTRAKAEDADMAAALNRDLEVMRLRVQRGYPLDSAFYTDREKRPS